MDWLFMYSLLLFFEIFTLALDSREIKEVTGVFMYPEGGQYKYNASTAREACRCQNAALATKAQMNRSLQHGLETCRYGWIDEQTAIVPRITADKKCGKGKTGLVEWKAALTKQFAAFCFQTSDLKQTPTMPTDCILTSKSTTTLPVQAHASTAVTPLVRTKMKPPASITSTAPPPDWKLAPVTSTSPPTPPVRTKMKPPASITSTAPPPDWKRAPVTSTSPPTPPVRTKMKPPASITSTAPPPDWKLAPVTSTSPPTPPVRTKMKPSASITSTPPPPDWKLAPVTSTSPPTPPVRTKMKPPASITSTSPPGWKLAPVTSTSPPTLTSVPSTARSFSISPTSPTRTSASSTSAPSLLSRLLLTSITARFSSSSSSPSSSSSSTVLSSTSLSPFTPSPSPPVTRSHTRGSATLQTVSSADTYLGGVHRALIVVAVILLILTLCGTVWYFLLKKQVFPSWSRRQQKDGTETEMWKHTDSDLDLHGNQKEEADEVTACLNSDNKTNSS